MFKELDPLLHSQLRLAIMSLLMSVESAEFTFIREQTQSTAGNLSVQLDKLTEAGYIQIEKTFRGKKPLTTCRITKKGLKAFEDYVNTLKEYINTKPQ
jgi:DNA-binding transcriptional ArsR family regulator